MLHIEYCNLILKPKIDFKTIINLFMISGQNYVFDVQRTWREVYDGTRRKLMKEANTNLCREEEAMEDGSESNIVPKNHECQDVQVN